MGPQRPRLRTAARALDAIARRLPRLRRAVPSTVGFATVLAAAFMAVVALAAGVPMVLNQRTVDALLEAQVQRRFDLLAANVGGRFAAQLGAADVVLDTLTTSFASGITDQAAGVRLARVLADLRETSPAVLALYFAKTDGGYALARTLTPDGLRRARAAGVDGATYEVQVGAPYRGRRLDSFAWLDAGFRVLGSSEPVPVAYDSRLRPWYVLARWAAKAVVSPPYRFEDVGASGLTISRRGGQDGTDVFAVDLTLGDLSKALRGSATLEGEQISLMENEGWLVADTAVDGLPVRLGDPGAAEPGRTPAVERVEAVFRAYRGNPRGGTTTLEVGGVALLASVVPFSFDNQDFLVADTVPVDVLRGPVARATRTALGAEIAVVLGAFLLALRVARSISKPVLALARDVESIVAFRPPAGERPATRVREISRLSHAVDTLGLTLRAFSTYMPRRLVRGIVEDGAMPTLGGTKREVVVLFSDIEGFSTLAEDSAPGALTEQLSRHLGAISDEVMAAGGTVDKFIGDSVMAFWDTGEGDADAACRAVMRARARLDDLNVAFAAEGLPRMRSRFGLHRGEGLVGSVGARERMNYTVLGHTVNVASRLESLNKLHGTTVLVSGYLAAAAPDFAFRQVDRTPMRGCREPIEVLELLGSREGVGTPGAVSDGSGAT